MTKPRKQQRESPLATTLEGRENQLISRAFDLAEKRMKEGTASATEVVHFLKLGSTREKLEQKRLENENLLLSAKIDNLKSIEKTEKLFEEAIKAMRTYTGQPPVEQEEFDDDSYGY